MRAIGGIALALALSGCAGSPVGDAIAGPEKLAERDDAYCRSIGAEGTNYTNCRLFMTQQRDNKHARAMSALRGGPTIQCTTTGIPGGQTTICH